MLNAAASKKLIERRTQITKFMKVQNLPIVHQYDRLFRSILIKNPSKGKCKMRNANQSLFIHEHIIEMNFN